MKYLNKLVLSAALVMASISTSLLADTYSFSYVFTDVYGSGGIFSGKLSGTQSGAYVNDVIVQELFVNGVQISGPIFNASYDPAALGGIGDFTGSGSAVVSFDQALNNFFFANSDYGSGDSSFTGYAFLVNLPGNTSATGFDIPNTNYSADLADGGWTLTVPDGGSTVGLLGLALVGFAALRRRITA